MTASSALSAAITAIPSEWAAFAPDVRVWRIDLDAPCAISILSSEERVRADRFAFPVLRQRFVGAHTALRLILGMVTARPPESLVFGQGAYGKPFLHAPLLEFNLTHSEGMGLVAVAMQPVGIDVEVVRPMSDRAGVMAQSFTAQEQAAVEGLPTAAQTAAFFRVWTRKEAVIKATGEGFRAVKSFSVPVDDGEPVMQVGSHRVFDLRLADGNFHAAVAVQAPKP